MNLRTAIDVFAKGFTTQRSFTHPYVIAREGKLTVLRDAPRRSGDARTEEILVYGLAPQESVQAVRAYAPRGRYLLNVFGTTVEDLKATSDAYKALGFRLMRREPFMVYDLSQLPDVHTQQSPWCVRRAMTLAEAERVRKLAGVQMIGEDDLQRSKSRIRLYFVEHEGVPIACVRSVHAKPTATWVANVYVEPAHRRKGIASAMMGALLADDARYGAKHSVLLASNAGALLYRSLGYDDIGLLQMFVPKA